MTSGIIQVNSRGYYRNNRKNFFLVCVCVCGEGSSGLHIVLTEMIFIDASAPTALPLKENIAYTNSNTLQSTL